MSGAKWRPGDEMLRNRLREFEAMMSTAGPPGSAAADAMAGRVATRERLAMFLLLSGAPVVFEVRGTGYGFEGMLVLSVGHAPPRGVRMEFGMGAESRN